MQYVNPDVPWHHGWLITQILESLISILGKFKDFCFLDLNGFLKSPASNTSDRYQT